MELLSPWKPHYVQMRLMQVGGSIGFVADERRINVGLTRARSSLIVIGNARALQRDARWGNLVRHASLLK